MKPIFLARNESKFRSNITICFCNGSVFLVKYFLFNSNIIFIVSRYICLPRLREAAKNGIFLVKGRTTKKKDYFLRLPLAITCEIEAINLGPKVLLYPRTSCYNWDIATILETGRINFNCNCYFTRKQRHSEATRKRSAWKTWMVIVEFYNLMTEW